MIIEGKEEIENVALLTTLQVRVAELEKQVQIFTDMDSKGAAFGREVLANYQYVIKLRAALQMIATLKITPDTGNTAEYMRDIARDALND